MAAPSGNSPDEEATCPSCLGYFRDHVVIDCGHSFCRDYLSWRWAGEEGEEASCPLCGKRVRRIPTPSPSSSLASLVEKTQELFKEVRARLRGEVCGNHLQPLTLFCKDDVALLCAACEGSAEHRHHAVVPLEEAAQMYKEMITNRLRHLNKERGEIHIHLQKYQDETAKESEALLKQTKAEMEKMKAEFKQMHRILEEKEKTLLAQMEEVEKDIAKKEEEHQDRLSKEASSHIGLIWEMKEKLRQPPVEFLQDVGSILKSCEKKATFQNPMASIRDLKSKIWGARDRNPFLDAVMEQFRDTLFPRPQLPKADVTLDPDTTHPRLFLSEDCKHVRREVTWQEVADVPQRFDRELYGLGRERFTEGRHCWEVIVGRGGTWAVGVARESVRRKGPVALTTGEGIWAVGRWEGAFRASDLSVETSLPLSEKLRSIWVCLNYEEGQVAFHDADLGSPLYTFSGVSFSGEALLPFFYVAGNGPLTISS